jgi:hypothetical protein
MQSTYAPLFASVFKREPCCLSLYLIPATLSLLSGAQNKTFMGGARAMYDPENTTSTTPAPHPPVDVARLGQQLLSRVQLPAFHCLLINEGVKATWTNFHKNVKQNHPSGPKKAQTYWDTLVVYNIPPHMEWTADTNSFIVTVDQTLFDDATATPSPSFSTNRFTSCLLVRQGGSGRLITIGCANSNLLTDVTTEQ